jgi:hypothetical protein
MNAIQFIKEYGVEAARIVIGSAEIGGIDTPSTNDLKRLVDSVDLVTRYGGIAEAKILHQDEFWDEVAFKILKQAIVDYEQLFGNT